MHLPSLAASLPAEFQANSWSILGIIVLLCLLVVKELISQWQGLQVARLKLLLNVAIAPLLLAFLWIVISHAANVLK